MVFIIGYAYTIKTSEQKVFKVFVFFLLLSDLVQILLTIAYVITGKLYLKNTLDFGLVLRATGLFGGMATFGFLNLCGFFMCYYKNSKKLALFFFINVFFSMSYKAILLLLLFLFINLFRKNSVKYSIIVILISVMVISSSPQLLQNLEKILKGKVISYSIGGESARSESYRVAFKYLQKNPIVGYGIGTFGGPASIKYNSRFYNEYGFNWFETNNLSTTDTYYPHLVVETGLIFSITYLAIIFFWLRESIRNRKYVVFWLVVSLLTDSLLSFGLNSLPFLIPIIFVPSLLKDNVSTTHLLTR